jgi:hypothetical protein
MKSRDEMSLTSVGLGTTEDMVEESVFFVCHIV